MTSFPAIFRASVLILTLIPLADAAAQSPVQVPPTSAQTAVQNKGQNTGQPVGQKPGGTTPATPANDNSASKPASVGEESASTTRLRLGPLDPATPPTDLPTNRPVIGVALGGGGALAMSDIGVLEWFEDNHIPVDVIAGTSMGSIIAALYSTGHTTGQMTHLLTEDSVSSVFRIGSSYTARNFRRREDSREIPGAVAVGLKHGVSFRNALLTDTGLNELLDKEFLAYNDQTDFNNLPIPFRCQATDLNDAKTVTFARGSLQDAVRASASIPGVFRPFQLNDHEYVDGAILENLPTIDVKAMKADVILAVSLPLNPVGKGDLDSILGVLQRAFAVGIENNEARDRKLANVVVMPDIKGFGQGDYLKTAELAKVGYAAAEAHRAELIKYAISPAAWEVYYRHRLSKERDTVGPLLAVKIKAPNDSVKDAVQRDFAPLINQPVDTTQVEALLAQVRSDGRFDADYTIGYDTTDATRPILLVTVSDKKTGPPFMDIGLNIAAQTGGVTRATISTILTDQDFGGYGSELRTKIDFGFLTRIETEYYRKLDNPGGPGYFAAPRANITRQPYYVYQGSYRVAERQSQFAGAGGDLGWSDGKTQELRGGWQYQNVEWSTTTGSDGLPNYNGNSQTARLRYAYDSQDRALVPESGMRLVSSVGYLYATPGSPSAPQLSSQIEISHKVGLKNIVLLNAEGATMFNRDVVDPFRYTLGGPLRLSASAIDQYRGTDYFLVTPGYLRRLRTLPAPLGQSLYAGGAFELGQMRSPDTSNITRWDVYFGLIAETPLGVLSVAPAIGNGDERKVTFTLGKLF